MATFTGNGQGNVADAEAGILQGFAGGTLAELQDTIGDTIDGAGGSDTIRGGRGADTIHGGTGDDSLVGGGTQGTTFDTVYGGEGNDTIAAGGAYAFLYGGAGDDIIDARHSFGEAEGGAGADTLTGQGFFGAALSYRNSPTRVVVNLLTNSASGGDAAGDTISGFANLIGSALNDILTASNASSGRIQGLAGNDRITGGTGNDILEGGAGDDSLYGGAGNDVLDGGPGADTMDGGEGNDTVSYRNQAEGVNVNLATQQGSAGAAGDVLVSIENLTGSTGNDVLRGSNAAESIDGSTGNDTVYGLGGNDDLRGGTGADTLFGGEGDDTISPGDGADSVAGGAGRDKLVYTNAFGALGIDLLTGGTGGEAAGDLYSSIEDVDGGPGSDSIAGSNAANSIVGGAGNDTLSGRGGDDTLNGGAGADSLDGGAGSDWLFVSGLAGATRIDLGTGIGTGGDAEGDRYAGIENVRTILSFGAAHTILGTNVANTLIGASGDDRLTGRGGADRLDGGSGRDVLTGGADADRFVFGTGGLFAQADVITDFGPGDILELAGATYSALGPSVQPSELRQGTAAKDANDFLIYHAATGRLWYDADADGAGAKRLIATLTNLPALSAADFDIA